MQSITFSINNTTAPLRHLSLAALVCALFGAFLTAACSPMPAEDAAAPDAPTAAAAAEDAAAAPVDAEDGEDGDDAEEAEDTEEADDLDAAETEAIATLQMVGDAVAKGAITIEEGNLFVRVHGVIHAPGAEGSEHADEAADHHGDDEGEVDMDAMKARERELLTHAVEIGTITQSDADGFLAIHDKLEAAGMLGEEQ